MRQMQPDNRRWGQGRQRGNALFLVLIAVALFAALAYAITQNGRGGSGTISKENALVVAGQVVEQQAVVRSAVARMVVTGVPISAITFDSGSSHSVFDPIGGASTGLPPPPTACSPSCTTWTYVPAASKSSGSFIYGVGSPDSDALAYLPAITLVICTQIQKGLGLPTAIVQQTGAAFDGVAGTYNAGGDHTTIKGAGSTIDGQEFTCWNNNLSLDPSKYTYYHTIYAQ